jgi:hypothetical protein
MLIFPLSQLAPGPTLTTCVTEEDFGKHVLEYTHPEFRGKVKGGQQVVVAGNAFGVGSSREVAVSALKGMFWSRSQRSQDRHKKLTTGCIQAPAYVQ